MESAGIMQEPHMLLDFLIDAIQTKIQLQNKVGIPKKNNKKKNK